MRGERDKMLETRREIKWERQASKLSSNILHLQNRGRRRARTRPIIRLKWR